ncbi:serpin family protein [Hymenobacter properus]|uniref:Serpin family protein n=1 Tax=Hymenobacter properus TaxID=2791026 RepID=A0A931BJY7_9BACT|nr:serpin family protein [Hymenobacter properus]MBF9143648.1 serpin family protein [Hymenobacter properus]MBR7722461.1 serpin family protein [Microvirga sp. SRT04]
MVTFTPKPALLGLLAGALLFTACQKHDVAAPDPVAQPTRPLTSAERSTVSSANDFAFQAFDKLRTAAPADNMCISPLSISAAITMAYNGADGSTKAAMKQTLGFQPLTDVEINEAYQSLFALLGGLDPQVTFTTGNSIWYGQQYRLQAPFVQANQQYFGATVRPVTFGVPATTTTINDWVNTQTRGKISTILNSTTANDVMYLINALYFKGAWTYRFNPQNTRPAPFYLENGTSVNADFMSLTTGRYRRYQDAQQQVIDLPYGNRRFSMTFVVPQGQSTLASVASRLTRTQLSTWLAAADSTGLELRVPKFKFAYENQLNDMLKQLGMSEAFTPQANFSRMLDGGPSTLFISEVKHKTYLEVNEEGTEAAAVTSVGAVTTSVPSPTMLNRPFLFLIREKSSGAILFIGQLMNP